MSSQSSQQPLCQVDRRDTEPCCQVLRRHPPHGGKQVANFSQSCSHQDLLQKWICVAQASTSFKAPSQTWLKNLSDRCANMHFFVKSLVDQFKVVKTVSGTLLCFSTCLNPVQKINHVLQNNLDCVDYIGAGDFCDLQAYNAFGKQSSSPAWLNQKQL